MPRGCGRPPPPYAHASDDASAGWREGSASSGITKELAVKILETNELIAPLFRREFEPVSIVTNHEAPTRHFGQIYFWRGLSELRRNREFDGLDKKCKLAGDEAFSVMRTTVNCFDSAVRPMLSMTE
jgi:hypothetical protein